MAETPSETPFWQTSEPETRQLRVAPEAGGRRLDVVLAEWLPATRAEVRRLLASGAVTSDGRPQRARHKGRALRIGEELRVEDFLPAAAQRIRATPDAPLALLAEAEAESGWLVVDKAAGTPVHPLRADELGTVMNAVVARHPGLQGVGEGGLRSGVVHRLDVETSGCLVVATREPAWQRIRAAFREHRVEKVYRALVLGRLDAPTEVALDLVVGRHRPALVRPARPGESGATRCETRITPLARLAGATLVEVRPRNGFLHQIRATLAQLGHPIAGDTAYGAGDVLPDPTPARRCLLHAARVAFEEIEASSPDPPDFTTALCDPALALGESGPA